MPPQIDRAARTKCLDEEGAEAFERIYDCRLRSDVYALWLSSRHKRFPQRSQPWLDFRDTRLTASVVPAVLEYVTFQGESRRKKFLSYAGLGAAFTSNPACDFGMKYEDSGMAAAERVLTSEQSRVVFLPFDIIDSARPDVEPFAYSPDGIGCDGTLAECKVPWRREIVPGLVKPNYDCQVQFGMHVIDGAVGLCDRTHFFEYRPPPNKYMLESEIFSVTQVARDAAWPSLHVWLLDEFWAEVTKYRSDHVMPDHYASEVRATKWWRERVLAEPHRFHKQQRVLFSAAKRQHDGDALPAATAATGADISWAGFGNGAATTTSTTATTGPPPQKRFQRTLPGSDIKW